MWIAGVKLSNTTDVLSSRLGLGEALGGLILLAIATNLPEIAITASAALSNNLGVAIGYAAIGAFSMRLDSFLLAFAGSLALPGLAMLAARLWLPATR